MFNYIKCKFKKSNKTSEFGKNRLKTTIHLHAVYKTHILDAKTQNVCK